MSVGKSKFIFKHHSEAAEGLTVITSNHTDELHSFRNASNENNVYADIIVEEEVWLGFNVTLLKGSHIGRGAIIGACSVVTKDIPPYAVAVGNPAKVVKFKWTIDQVMEHELLLYPEDKRFTKDELISQRTNFKQ